MSWGGNAPQLCVRQPLLEKGICKVSMAADSHCWSCDWGDFKSTRGKSRHPAHLEPAGQPLDPILPMAVCQFIFRSCGWGHRCDTSDAGPSLPLHRGWAGPRGWGTPVCGEVEGSCAHPFPPVSLNYPLFIARAAHIPCALLEGEAVCQCPWHPAQAEIAVRKGSAEHETDLLGLLEPFYPLVIH